MKGITEVRGLSFGGTHNLHSSVPLPGCDTSPCPPKRRLLQSGFSRGALCHPRAVPRRPFPVLSNAGDSWALRLAGEGGLARSFLSPCPVHFTAGEGEKHNAEPAKPAWEKLHP